MQGVAGQKHAWLKKKIHLKQTRQLHEMFSELKLHTVCKEARCTNISECFSKKVATFLIMGNSCTRNCRFCAVKHAVPEPVDGDEPRRICEAVAKLGLKHVVITSVTRDDLADGGASGFANTFYASTVFASGFANTVDALKAADRSIKVEVLVPDFKVKDSSIKTVLQADPDIFAHNLETVPGLYPQVRKDSLYKRSLEVLRKAKILNSSIYTKSGLMLGLGEERAEVLGVMNDLRKVQCDFLSLGQYLAPSKEHYKVQEFIKPHIFDYYRQEALSMGFLHVQSGPYVRSSYIADEYLCADLKGV